MSAVSGEERVMAASAGEFGALVRVATDLLAQKDVAQAAVVTEIAALHGAYNHHGALISAPLEDALKTIGLQMAPGVKGTAPKRPAAPKHILHVLTAAKDVGGDSRFVWRWIQRDSGHRYSVAVTRQRHFEIPAVLREAVAASGGSIHHLDDAGADIRQRATKLREAALGVDAVFLHVYVEDIIPSLAFADTAGLPPIVFVMQADHQFLTGISCSNLVLHMRDSGAVLSQKRRSVKPDRLTFLPIPLDPVTRTQSRQTAKKALGLPEDAVLLLSIARAGKYAGSQPPSFAMAGVQLLQKYPHAHLIVLGPKEVGEWQTARELTQGRLKALGERSDTKTFYEAADIYLDSYPFSSNTSLLEAGGHGVPLVSLFGYSPDAAVLGAGTPALDRVLHVVHNADDYAATVGRLIESTADREEAGERTRQTIEHFHYGPGWQQHLEDTFVRLATAETTPATGAPVEERTTELDELLSRIFRGSAPIGVAIERRVRELPYFERLSLLRRLMAVDKSFGFGVFLPQPVEKILSPYLGGWRTHPLAKRLLART